VNDFKVVAGLNTAVREVAQIYVPDGYLTSGNEAKKQHDIALVRLVDPLPCDDPNLRAISLLERTAAQSIDECIAWATGFGLHSKTEVRTTDLASKYNLDEVEMQVFDTDHCQRWPNGGDASWPETTVYVYPFQWRGFSAYEKLAGINIVDSQICAYSPADPIKNACTGDSGGPLIIDVQEGSSNKYVQVGITSYGVGCGQVPGLYTDVSYPAFKEWIMSEYNGAHWTPFTLCDNNCVGRSASDCAATTGCRWIAQTNSCNDQKWADCANAGKPGQYVNDAANVFPASCRVAIDMFQQQQHADIRRPILDECCISEPTSAPTSFPSAFPSSAPTAFPSSAPTRYLHVELNDVGTAITYKNHNHGSTTDYEFHWGLYLDSDTTNPICTGISAMPLDTGTIELPVRCNSLASGTYHVIAYEALKPIPASNMADSPPVTITVRARAAEEMEKNEDGDRTAEAENKAEKRYQF
jgi:secreted trypsin-like serine protease